MKLQKLKDFTVLKAITYILNKTGLGKYAIVAAFFMSIGVLSTVIAALLAISAPFLLLYWVIRQFTG